MTSQGFPTSTVLKRQSSGAVRRLIAVLERVLGRRDYRNALTKDGVKEPAYARNHDDHEIPKQMGRIRMATRNPQSWFSHGAPPTDELKSQALRRLSACASRDIHDPTRPVYSRPRFSPLIDRCHASCYVIRHKEKDWSQYPSFRYRYFPGPTLLFFANCGVQVK